MTNAIIFCSGPRPASRALLLVIATALLTSLLPSAATADTRVVDCNAGRRIVNTLRLPAGRQLTITVRGICTENVTITRDDVTLQGDAGAVINPADPSQATIVIDGARRVKLLGLTVNGGVGAIVGTAGTRYELAQRASPVVACVVQGGTRFGVVASYGSAALVDHCTVQNVGGDGLLAANASSVIVTNSTVQNNTGNGVTATRNSHARVGQDASGGSTALPVTVADNGRNGIAIDDSSTGIVLGGEVTGSGLPGIFVGRGSSARIGTGSGGSIAGTTVRGNHRDGIYVEGGSAVILASTISQNERSGIRVANGGNARIGIKTDNSAYSGNVITDNGGIGITVVFGASAFIGGTTISANGTDASYNGGFRFGVLVSHARADLVGDNTISGHPNSGVFVRAGTARVGDNSFGLPFANTISGNGNGGPLGALGGVIAFQGATVEIRGATIRANLGQGVAAFENAVVDISLGTVIEGNLRAPDQFGSVFDAGHGVVARFNSTVRLRDAGTVIRDNAGDGIQIASGTGVEFTAPPPPGTTPISVIANEGLGLRCFVATNYTGDVRGVVSNNGGNDDGTNSSRGNIPGCTRY